MRIVLGLAFAVIGMRLFFWEALPSALRGMGAVIAVLGVCLVAVGLRELVAAERSVGPAPESPHFIVILRSGTMLGRGEVWLTEAGLVVSGRVSPPGMAFGLEPLYPERMRDAVIKPELFRRLEAELDDAIAAEFVRPIRRTLSFAGLPDPASLIVETAHANEFTMLIPQTVPGDLPVTMTFGPEAGAEFLDALTAARNGAHHNAHT